MTTTKPTYPELRHERNWFYLQGEGDDLEMIFTSDRERATGTQWAITSHHPDDGHEFGIALTTTSVTDVWEELEPSYAAAGERAMHEHVEGSDGDNA